MVEMLPMTASTEHELAEARVGRLLCQFPHLDAEVIAAVVEGAGGTANVQAVALLHELQSEALASLSTGQEGGTQSKVIELTWQPSGNDGGLVDLGPVGHAGWATLHIRVPAALLEGPPDRQPPRLHLVLPSGELWPLYWHEPPLVFRPPTWGWYRMLLDAPAGRAVARFHVTSVLGDYVEALSELCDVLAWSWDGSTWTEALSDASVNLAVGVDAFMEHLSSMIGPMLASTRSSFKSLIDAPKRVLENQLARILEQHDAQAVGMMHTAVRDLWQQAGDMTMLTPFLNSSVAAGSGMQMFFQAASEFERARQDSIGAPQRGNVRAALQNLVFAADRYVAHMNMLERSGAHVAGAAALLKQWNSAGGLRAELREAVTQDTVTLELRTIVQLQSGGASVLAAMLAQVMSASSGCVGGDPAVAAESMSFLSPDKLLAGGQELRALVTRWSETLISGIVVVGSAVQPRQFSSAPCEVERSSLTLLTLLQLGFGYVVQGDDPPAATGSSESCECTLAAMIDRTRAALPLGSQEAFLQERRRRSRLRDVMRAVRSQAKQGRHFSLRVNSSLEVALTMLREHHEDNWVGSVLEKVWSEMFAKGDVVIFELWVLEKDGTERLIAADFGHPHSHRCFYVATRFFDRAYRSCMPGFILAFAEAEALAKRGFQLWDLGGTNSSPMMQYKSQVAIEMRKGLFFDELHAVQQQEHTMVAPPKLLPGVIVPQLREEDLWGASASNRPLEKGGSCNLPPPPQQWQQPPPQSQQPEQQVRPHHTQLEAQSSPRISSEPSQCASPRAAARALPQEAPIAASFGVCTAGAAQVERPSAGGDRGKLAAQAQLQKLHTELCASGWSAVEAAAEALRRLSRIQSCTGEAGTRAP